MKKKSLAAFAAALGLILVGPISPAHAGTTPDADKYEGKTLCGSYRNGGDGYGYHREKDITISSAGWSRLLANDPYGLKVSESIWSKTKPQFGSLFPIHNYSSVTYKTVNNTNGTTYQLRTNENLNKAMNNLTCGSTFHLGQPKSIQSATAAQHSDLIAPGRFKVIQVRTNGISFIGTEGVMNGAVMNFRIRSGASRTFLNVHATGPAYNWASIENAARSFMESQADATWETLATSIGKAQ